MSERYFSSYDGKTVMADVDVNGNSLELTIEDEKVKAIGNIPVGGGDESVWTDETFNALADDDGDDILDENNEAIGDEDAETLWATRDGVGFKAKRAEADINGNSLELHVNAEGKIDKIGNKYIEGTGEAPVDAYSKEETNALLANKQDALSGLPTMAANQFLQTNANNEITWGTLPASLDEVYIVTYGSSVSVSTVSAEQQAGKAVFCSKGHTLLPLQAIGSNICSFNGVIGAENSTSMDRIIMAHVELVATGMWSYSTISIPAPSGTSKTLTIDANGTVAWTATPVELPQYTSSDENKVLRVNDEGNLVWSQMETDTFGSITDDEGDEIQDEEGNAIGDENSVELWSSFNGIGFGAERAVADADGNNIAETYAKKGEASSVTTSYDAQTKTLTINI